MPVASNPFRISLSFDTVDYPLTGLIIFVDYLPQRVKHLRSLVSQALQIHRLHVDWGNFGRCWAAYADNVSWQNKTFDDLVISSLQVQECC